MNIIKIFFFFLGLTLRLKGKYENALTSFVLDNQLYRAAPVGKSFLKINSLISTVLPKLNQQLISQTNSAFVEEVQNKRLNFLSALISFRRFSGPSKRNKRSFIYIKLSHASFSLKNCFRSGEKREQYYFSTDIIRCAFISLVS